MINGPFSIATLSYQREEQLIRDAGDRRHGLPSLPMIGNYYRNDVLT